MERLDNSELRSAIQYAADELKQSNSASAAHEPMKNHLIQLLKAQQLRALPECYQAERVEITGTVARSRVSKDGGIARDC